MNQTVIMYICFIVPIVIAMIGSGIYFSKTHSKDPVTGEFLPNKEIEANNERRKNHDTRQLIYDERAQIDEAMRKIGEICPEFHQKYGKGMNIVCHIQRMKALIREYGEIPNEKALIDYQNEFYCKVYDSIQSDIYTTIAQYLVGKKDIEEKYQGKIDLRVELNKYAAHLNNLKELLHSSR